MLNGTVTCKTCGTGYPAIFEETEQGVGCAAVVSGSRIVGHYGSAAVDMEAWGFAGERPAHVRDGVICDKCVTALQEDKAIVFLETGFL